MNADSWQDCVLNIWDHAQSVFDAETGYDILEKRLVLIFNLLLSVRLTVINPSRTELCHWAKLV